MIEKKAFALCTQDLFRQHRQKLGTVRDRRIKSSKEEIKIFKAGNLYRIVDESSRNKLILIDERGQRHQVSGNRKTGWFSWFIVKRRVLIEKTI